MMIPRMTIDKEDASPPFIFQVIRWGHIRWQAKQQIEAFRKQRIIFLALCFF